MAGGRSSEPGDSLRFTETAAGHGQKMYPPQQKVRRMRTDFFHKDDVIILVFVIARCISLAPLPRECLWGRASRHSADGCMHYVSACKTIQCSCMQTFNTSLLTRDPLHLLLALVLYAPGRNLFDSFTLSIPGIFGTLGITAVTTQRFYFFLKLSDFRGSEYSPRRRIILKFTFVFRFVFGWRVFGWGGIYFLRTLHGSRRMISRVLGCSLRIQCMASSHNSKPACILSWQIPGAP